MTSRSPLAISLSVEGLLADSRGSRPKDFLSRRCSAIPLQSMESFPESTVSRSLAPKWPDGKLLVRKTLCHSLICREGVLCLERASFQAIEKFYRPATPSPFPLYATAGGTGMAERKRFLSRKASAIAFKEGRSFLCLDHVTGRHRSTGFLSPGPGLHDTARKSRQPKPVRSGHSGPTLKPH